jgi:hypothetical protein
MKQLLHLIMSPYSPAYFAYQVGIFGPQLDYVAHANH